MNRKIRSSYSLSPAKRALAALLGALCLLTGCSGTSHGDDTLRIGVALYSQDDTFIASLARDFERAAQDAEAEQGQKITLSIADGLSNQTTQLDQIDRFLERSVDVLCVNIVDRTAAAVLIDKAEDADVPIIFFNRQPVAQDIARWEQVYYVGARAEQSGQLQGELVRDAWFDRQDELDRNGDGVLQYAMLEGEPGHQDTLLRTEYAVHALTEAGISVEKTAGATANWSRAQAAAKVQSWLEQPGPNIEVLFSNNDDMALGAIDAYEAAGLPLPLIVGIDATEPALQAIQSGKLYGTVQNDAQGIARAMLQLALTLHAGADPADAMELESNHYIWLPYSSVTADNLDEFLPEAD